MPSPKSAKTGKPHLRRDDQQWVFDYIIKETGKTFHFQPDGRGRLPRTVRSHDMIAKHVGLAARRSERLAQAEADAGHRETAMELYYQAALQYADAQHVVFETNDEKRYLHGGLIRCYDKTREYAPYRIEHVDIAWNGTVVSGNLHLAPGAGRKPLVFYVPGCDQTKEAWPHPYYNQALQRGMHAFSFDGPGQGESNLRRIRLTADNYEEAAGAAIDYLIQRPEVDPKKIGVYALSFGSFWGMQIAAKDRRIAAAAAPWASFVDKYYLMTEESPRYKQLFAYLTQSSTEEELDKVVSAMTMEGRMEKITCPTLITAGEYDPRAPLDEVYRLFDQMKAPAELWVMPDQHHNGSVTQKARSAVWEADIHAFVCDWLRDRFNGIPVKHPGKALWLEPSGAGPNAQGVSHKRRWFD
ncbi:MAG TPA: prolyl oligopeptidase family serine peptidase [Burkholderiales bacterium]|jgi:pimeloyl-ACP methyl ester carboxylesterase|nr:prolyl oligopeptidase family serine peptidase [Burkholderiales bacterium]